MGNGSVSDERHTDGRKARMAVLSQCDSAVLKDSWNKLGRDPGHTPLRGPETGLVMLRGRIGGTGRPFNFGEATVTRATVRLENGAVGHAMALGRDKVKAQLSAVIDAMCQDDADAELIDRAIIEPLKERLEARDRKRSAETAATRVDFFTMVRGED
jgi:alpha-D-ribose 1-methylphosphonate 5-triphosphate synthase subunit PhnG